MFIDLPNGDVLMPFTDNVLDAAEIAKEKGGRLRLVVNSNLATNDPMVGCIELGDWRNPR